MKNIFNNAFLLSRTLRPWERDDPDIYHHISVSPENTKLGQVPSISLPPEESCHNNIPCADACYARGMEKGAKGSSVQKAWQRNYDIWRSDPDKFFYELGMWMKDSTRFRVHVGGDCPNYDYFVDLMDTIEACPNCKVLVFTKKPEYIEKYITEGNTLPSNVKLVISKWGKLFNPKNPYGLPTSDVEFTTKKRKQYNSEERPDNSFYCNPYNKKSNPTGDTCETCFFDDRGCWTMPNGAQVIFKEH